MRVMFKLEDAFYNIAKASGYKTLIICDRGGMDASAYMDDDAFQKLLGEEGWNKVGIRDSRYDCVIHMQTAAIGAEAHYNLDTNRTRTETPEQARWLDTRVKECWLGHSYFAMIDNSTDFRTKIGRVVEVNCLF